MAYNAKVGSFNIDSSVTAGNTQSVTGVGFQPKIVLFWWSGSTASSDSVAGGTISCGFGAAISSSSRFCAAFVSEDGQGTTDTYRYQSAAECIRIYSDTGTLDGLADFSSLDADGFTLTIDDQFGSDWRISYLALGGSDLTNVYIGNDEMPAATGEYDVTGVGFQPEAVIIAGVYGGIPSGSDGANISIGMATGSSNQGVAAINSDDNEATSDTHRYGYNGECYAFPSQYGVGHRQAFVSFGADGFTLNRLEGTSGSIKFSFICLAGGQYEVGDLTTRTDGNDIEENLAGSFEPVAVLFASANMALSTQDSVSSHARLSIGAASATDERAVQAISDEDNLATTETAYTNQDDAVYAHVVDDAIEALMDIKSFDADGFTAVMDTPEATSACSVTYLAIGAAAGGGTTYYETPAGALTPAGTVVRAITQSARTGALTPAGAVTKATTKGAFSGALTFEGAVEAIKTALRSLAGALTFGGAIARQAGKPQAGAITPAGTIARAISTTKAGAITPSGTVAKLTVKSALAGALTFTGAVLRATAKGLAGELTPAGTVLKSTVKAALSGSLTPAGVVNATKVALRSFAGALTFAGAVATNPRKALGGSITPSGAIAKAMSKGLAGAITFVGEALASLVGAVTPVSIGPVIRGLFSRLTIRGATSIEPPSIRRASDDTPSIRETEEI